MRHLTERRPANLRRTLPQWARSPTPDGVHKTNTLAPNPNPNPIRHPLASDSPPETPIAPPEMPPAHDVPPATGQMFLF
jgi:hypothetical protein